MDENAFWYINGLFASLFYCEGKKYIYIKMVYMECDSFCGHFNTLSLWLRPLYIIQNVTQLMALKIITINLTAKPNCDIQYKCSSPSAEQKSALILLQVKHTSACTQTQCKKKKKRKRYLNRGSTLFGTIFKRKYVWKYICQLLLNQSFVALW